MEGVCTRRRDPGRDAVPEADVPDAAQASLCFGGEPGPTPQHTAAFSAQKPSSELSASTLRFFTYQPLGLQDPRLQRAGKRKRRGNSSLDLLATSREHPGAQGGVTGSVMGRCRQLSPSHQVPAVGRCVTGDPPPPDIRRPEMNTHNMMEKVEKWIPGESRVQSASETSENSQAPLKPPPSPGLPPGPTPAAQHILI